MEAQARGRESSGGGSASLFSEPAAALPAMGDHERLVMQHLRQDEALQLDELLERLVPELASGEVFSALFELELAGRVKQMPGKNYVKSF